jgi:multiple sugar transport system permease protein
MLRVLRWIVYVAAVVLMNFPVIVTLITSFKSPGEITVNPSLMIQHPSFANYLAVLEVNDRLNIFAYLWNSFVASTIGTTLAIILAFPAAYAIARGEFGRRTILPMIINLHAVPLIIFGIPIYMMFQWLALLDTQLGLGLVLTVVNLPITLVVIVNAIRDVPIELDEAAQVDGASVLRTLMSVIAPVVRPALATTFIFGFITAWNEFLFGLLLTTSQAVPVTVGASFFFAASGGGIQWGLASAVMIVAALPPMVIGLVAYRQISGSLTAGAVKG